MNTVFASKIYGDGMIPYYSHYAKNQLSSQVRYLVHNRDEYLCFYCGIEVSKDGEDPVLGLSIDHICPESHGGCGCMANLVTACRRCNSRKAQKNMEEYREYLAHVHGNYGPCAKLISKAQTMCTTPFDQDLIKLIDWLNAQKPVIAFWGDRPEIRARLGEHEESCKHAVRLTE
jgi:hypothetical protein